MIKMLRNDEMAAGIKINSNIFSKLQIIVNIFQRHSMRRQVGVFDVCTISISLTAIYFRGSSKYNSGSSVNDISIIDGCHSTVYTLFVSLLRVYSEMFAIMMLVRVRNSMLYIWHSIDDDDNDIFMLIWWLLNRSCNCAQAKLVDHINCW